MPSRTVADAMRSRPRRTMATAAIALVLVPVADAYLVHPAAFVPTHAPRSNSAHMRTVTSEAHPRRLEYAEIIAEFSPNLRSAVGTLDETEMRHIDSLYAELTGHTGYLTAWPGNTAGEQLRLALEVAFLSHRGQKRKSGEAFIIHPVQVASILAQSRMDLPSLTSGLLHDTVEDTALTFGEIETLFGPEVRTIVEGETKVSKLPKVVRSALDASEGLKSKQDEQAENLRSMFVAMADDWR